MCTLTISRQWPNLSISPSFLYTYLASGEFEVLWYKLSWVWRITIAMQLQFKPSWVWRIAVQTQLILKKTGANIWQISQSFLQLGTGEFEELLCKHSWVWRIAIQTAMFEELQCKSSWVWRIAMQTQLIWK